MAKCSTCDAEIVWGLTEKGAKVPMNPPENRFVDIGAGKVGIRETWISHFATCPQADLHRKADDEG